MKSEDFENHAIFEKLDQLAERYSDEEARELIGIDQINFFETAEKYIRDRIRLTIPAIVQETELTNISQEINNALSQINSFIGNKNQGHIQNASNHLYTAITRVRNLPLPFAKNDLNFSKKIATFENAVKKKYESLEKKKNDLDNELDSLDKEIKENKQELSQVKDALKQKENEIKNLNNNFETEFKNIRATATQSYEDSKAKFRSEFDAFVQEAEKEAKGTISSINTDTNEIVDKLNTKLEEAKKIVGVIGDHAVTGNFKQVADNHKKTADLFRWVAIGLMSILSGILVYIIWDISTGDFDWVKSAIRIAAAAALSYPATYAARESNKHRKLENLNRQSELELAAINPFIELLEEGKKRAIKEKLVDKYFGNSIQMFEDSSSNDTDNISMSGLENLLRTIFNQVKK
jgi:cell division septum initiation protein DivIVA